MKKRNMVTLLTATMLMGLLTACSTKEAAPAQTQAPATTQAPAATQAPATTQAVQTTQAAAAGTVAAESEYGPILSKVKESGVIIAGINAQSPPWRFHKIVDGKDKLCGFEVSMCYGIADLLSEKLGREVTCVISDMTFPGVLASLQSGQIDFAPSLAGTAERRENMDFSLPYHRSLQTVVIRKDKENDPIFDPAKKMDGVVSGSLQGSSTSVTFREQYPLAKLSEYESTPDIVLAVANGKIDAGVLNEKYAILICKANPDLMIDYDLAYDIPVERDPGASLAVPKGNEDFVAILDEWLEGILSDGTFASYEKDAITELDDEALLEGYSTLNLLK